MIVRIPQRTQDDCAICTVAMVMGFPYSYERVFAYSAKYEKISSEGKFIAWWEPYFHDEGYEGINGPFLLWYLLLAPAGAYYSVWNSHGRDGRAVPTVVGHQKSSFFELWPERNNIIAPQALSSVRSSAYRV